MKRIIPNLAVDNCKEDLDNNLYSSLAKKGNVIFELQKTFWGSYHGVVTDCFGITWSLDYSGKRFDARASHKKTRYQLRRRVFLSSGYKFEIREYTFLMSSRYIQGFITGYRFFEG